MSDIKNVNIEREISELIESIKLYIDNFNEKKFQKALKFAMNAHKGQLRKDQLTPYILHPIKTAKILTKLHVDEDTLIASLLHDVPEDTKKSLKEVQYKFGKKVAFLVDGITKLSKVYYRHDMAERQVESLKKLLIHSAKDPRVILIKLADRLHNMRTLQYVRPEKRLRIAKETLEIYVPIANLLGIDEIRRELENLCFKNIFPKDFERIKRKLQEMKKRQANVLGLTIKKVKEALNMEAVPHIEITGREKTPYSIFKKTIRQGKPAEDLDDLLGLRIITDNRKDCYLVLGIIHTIFTPKLGRFKDYIAAPKANGYQSIHTVVFGLHGQVTEFQIRTKEMHLEAQYGIAAHFFYHLNKETPDPGSEQHSRWAKQILEYQKENIDNQHFLEALKIDIFQDRIFTFTPQGDTIDLPVGATAIDFAYSVHTDVGNNAAKAEINNEIVPLTTTLKTGDTVRIITAEKPKAPNREWLVFVKTNLARNKIRDALRKISRKRKLSIGRRLMQKEFDRAGIGLVEEMPKKKVKELIARFGNKKGEHKCRNLKDVLVAIGEGSINPVEVVKVLFPQTKFIMRDKFNFFRRILHLKEARRKRVELSIKAIDRVGASRDILSILSEQNINVVKLRGFASLTKQIFTIKLIIEVESFEQLSYIFTKLENIEEILEVQREFQSKKIVFYFFAAFTLMIWFIHPLMIYYISSESFIYSLHGEVIYVGIGFLCLLAFQLKRLTHKSFPSLRETTFLWRLTLLVWNIAAITIVGEIYFFHLDINWIFVVLLVGGIYSYLLFEYRNYKREQNA